LKTAAGCSAGLKKESTKMLAKNSSTCRADPIAEKESFLFLFSTFFTLQNYKDFGAVGLELT
jgi:hypothetical protein